MKAVWTRFLQASLWVASIGLMAASSGLDGAYLAKLMPPGWAWLGLLLNTMTDLTSELGMYWYGRLQMDRSTTKQKRARWLLVGQVVLVSYAWLFSWRQLVPIIARVDPDALWMAPIGAAFIPSALIVVGYTQALLAGRVESERNEAKLTVSESESVQLDDWPIAKVDDFRRIVAGMNGQRSELDAERLQVELSKRQLAMPSVSTVRRWLNDR